MGEMVPQQSHEEHAFIHNATNDMQYKLRQDTVTQVALWIVMHFHQTRRITNLKIPKLWFQTSER